MDEAFSGQDLRTKAELQELFLSLWGNSPKTVIAATHEFSEAWILAQRVTVLSAIPAQVRFQKDITTPLAVRREFSDGSESKLLSESVINAFATD